MNNYFTMCSICGTDFQGNSVTKLCYGCMEKELALVKADNASLLKAVNEYYSKARMEYHKEMGALGLKETYLMLKELVESEHPGTEILKRLGRLDEGK